MRYLILIVSLFVFISCTKSEEEKTRKVIDQAQAFLTTNKCQEAINVLEAAGIDSSDPYYLQVYASSYACRSGFGEIKFFADDIPLIDASDSQSFFSSLTQLSTSSETSADSNSYTDLLRGINIIINAGGGSSPSQVARTSMYGQRKAGDMGTQALYMLVAQLGKYLHLYGNVNSSGVKGGGSAGSQCFVAYDDPVAIAALGVLPAANACDPGDAGHPALSLASSDLTRTKKRMCEGLMIVTNLSDILKNIILPDNDSIGDLTDIQFLVDQYVDDFASSADSDYVSLIGMTKQSDCETFVTPSAKFAKLQQMFVALFEANLE